MAIIDLPVEDFKVITEAYTAPLDNLMPVVRENTEISTDLVKVEQSTGNQMVLFTKAVKDLIVAVKDNYNAVQENTDKMDDIVSQNMGREFKALSETEVETLREKIIIERQTVETAQKELDRLGAQAVQDKERMNEQKEIIDNSKESMERFESQIRESGNSIEKTSERIEGFETPLGDVFNAIGEVVMLPIKLFRDLSKGIMMAVGTIKKLGLGLAKFAMILGTALIGMTVFAVKALALAAPFILVGVAIYGLIKAISFVGDWISNFFSDLYDSFANSTLGKFLGLGGEEKEPEKPAGETFQENFSKQEGVNQDPARFIKAKVNEEMMADRKVEMVAQLTQQRAQEMGMTTPPIVIAPTNNNAVQNNSVSLSDGPVANMDDTVSKLLSAS